MTRKQTIKSIFDYEYKKESGICKYFKLTTNDNTTHNYIDTELNTNSLTADGTQINYNNIKNIELF